MIKRTAVVLLSGGLDSATCLAVARADGFSPVALTIAYGQRHAVEIAAAKRIAQQQGAIPHRLVTLDLRAIGGSALTDDIAVPKRQRPEDIGSEIPTTYVPARNTIFLGVALGLAEVVGARDIFIGTNVVDYSGYPDCRPEFITAFEALARVATKVGVDGERIAIRAPLSNMSKPQIILQARALGVDLALSHSCYDPQGAEACGACDACLLRLKGFAEAGLADPIRYAKR